MTAGRAALDRVEHALRADPRLADDAIGRPHELLTLVWRTPVAPNGRSLERLCVAVTPASVWDAGPEVLAPLSERVAEGRALVVVVGRPRTSLADAATRGLAGILDE